MAAQVDTLRLLAQPELTENRTARGTDTKEIENKHIQMGRRGGDGHRGGEDSRGCGGTETGGVWDKCRRQSEHQQTLFSESFTNSLNYSCICSFIYSSSM